MTLQSIQHLTDVPSTAISRELHSNHAHVTILHRFSFRFNIHSIARSDGNIAPLIAHGIRNMHIFPFGLTLISALSACICDSDMHNCTQMQIANALAVIYSMRFIFILLTATVVYVYTCLGLAPPRVLTVVCLCFRPTCVHRGDYKRKRNSKKERFTQSSQFIYNLIYRENDISFIWSIHRAVLLLRPRNLRMHTEDERCAYVAFFNIKLKIRADSCANSGLFGARNICWYGRLENVHAMERMRMPMKYDISRRYQRN